MRVLLAGDEPEVQEATAAYLRRMGLTVHVAESLPLVLQVARKVIPHAVVLGGALSPIQTSELARSLRALKSMRGSLIVGSSLRDPEEIARASGCDLCLPVPPSPHTLYLLLRAETARRRESPPLHGPAPAQRSTDAER